MTRSKLSTKVVLLAIGIGLSTAAFAGSRPAAAQSFLDEYECPIGSVYDPTYGCTVAGEGSQPLDQGTSRYLPHRALYGGPPPIPPPPGPPLRAPPTTPGASSPSPPPSSPHASAPP